jgi:two-component system response regulator YesN
VSLQVDTMTKQEWDFYLNTLSIITANCSQLYDLQAHQLVPKSCDCDRDNCPLCFFEKENDDKESLHLSALLQAQRSDGLHVYYCSEDYMYLAAIIFAGKKNHIAGLITGPFIDENSRSKNKIRRDNTCILKLDSKRLDAVKVFVKTFVQTITKHIQVRKCSETMDDSQDELTKWIAEPSIMELTAGYPLELEEELRSQMQRGNTDVVIETINKYFAILYFSKIESFDDFKLQAFELITIISQVLMEEKGNSELILDLNRQHKVELQMIDDFTVFSTWLAKAVHRYINLAFNLDDVYYDAVMRECLRYIEAHFHETISLDHLASHVFFSKSYVSKLFRENVGLTFIAYLNNLRVEHSCNLLLTTHLQISEIAQQCGFDDRSYFSKVFKRIKGLKPSQYRRFTTA